MRSNGRKSGAAALMCLVLSLVAWGAAARTPQKAPTGTGGTIATVGSRGVSRDEFQRAADQALADYERLRGSKPGPEIRTLIRRQALERLIRSQLMILEARRRGVPVSEAEVDAEFKTHPFFNPGGHFDAALFAKVKAANSAEYRASTTEIRAQIAGRKLARTIETENTPDAAELRAQIARSMSRATVDVLALRLGDFLDGVREPRAVEVQDYYVQHARDFIRPTSAEISVIQVAESSIARGKAVADSLIGELHRGRTFEGLGAERGGSRFHVIVSRDEFPVWWTPDNAARDAVLGAASGKGAPAPGTVLSTPFEGRDGWLIVRVEAVHPAGPAPLRDVAKEIRRRLREDAGTLAGGGSLREIYETRRSMLRTPAYKIRYAMIDTTRIAPGEPPLEQLQAYYNEHLADFSAYDNATASIRTRTFDEVRGSMRTRWLGDKKLELTRSVAAKLEAAWRQNRRDRALESQAAWVREAGPLPLGGAADTSAYGRLVGDSLVARRGALGTGIAAIPEGMLVFHVYQAIADYAPTFEEYRPVLLREQRERQSAEDEKQAHAEFDRDPGRWSGGKGMKFTEVIVEYMNPIDVPLTRQEVERYHIEHIDDYSAPEQVRARHILISPTSADPQDEAEARHRAEDLLRRVRAGEDFADLARRYTDDLPTKESGGDLGFFGRGVMLEPVERAAFALQTGEVSDIVRTQEGFHIIKVVDRLPMVSEPLSHMYANVGSDAAAAKAQRIAKERADSIIAVARTPAQVLAAARKLKLEVRRQSMDIAEIDRMPKELASLLEQMIHMRPGEILPRTRPMKGFGVSIMWLDSLGTASPPTWDNARDQVLLEHRRAAALRAMYAKRAEFDSLVAAGWAIDSVAALWGGFEPISGVTPGKGISDLGRVAKVDSLLFGGDRPAALAVGELSGWVELGLGLARIRLVSRNEPAADLVSGKVEGQRRLTIERRLQVLFDELARAFPVRILDPEMREITLPPLPDRVP